MRRLRTSMANKSRRALVIGLFAAFIFGIANPNTSVAQLITGDIGFASIFSPATATSATTFAGASLASANSIDYNGNGLRDSGAGSVILATGSFSGVGPSATLFDFTFNPSAAVSPLWTAGIFSFALSSIWIDTQNSNTLSLVGTGVVSGTGFTDTPGSWNFTGNPLNGGGNFVFSAGSVAPVPEPEIYAMMAIGLGLLGWVGRRKRREMV